MCHGRSVYYQSLKDNPKSTPSGFRVIWGNSRSSRQITKYQTNTENMTERRDRILQVLRFRQRQKVRYSDCAHVQNGCSENQPSLADPRSKCWSKWWGSPRRVGHEYCHREPCGWALGPTAFLGCLEEQGHCPQLFPYSFFLFLASSVISNPLEYTAHWEARPGCFSTSHTTRSWCPIFQYTLRSWEHEI